VYIIEHITGLQTILLLATRLLRNPANEILQLMVSDAGGFRIVNKDREGNVEINI
jgi:hypothetical protein